LLRHINNEEEKKKLKEDFKMLINPDKMGSRFKLISIRKYDLKQTPVGFLQ
jgi:SAM-dependent MidA family methyltransferase